MSRRRFQNRKWAPDDPADQEPEVHALGYQARIFNDPGVALALTKPGQFRMGWLGGTPVNGETLWVDRYDIRNWIENVDELETLSGDQNPYKVSHQRDAIGFEFLEYHDLNDGASESDSDDPHKRWRLNPTTGQWINLHGRVPFDVELPPTQEISDLIYRTAKFIAKSREQKSENAPDLPMEAYIQAKQSHNPLFRFLNRLDDLYPFYNHILDLCERDLAWSDAEESSDAVQEVTGNESSVVASPPSLAPGDTQLNQLVMYDSDSGTDTDGNEGPSKSASPTPLPADETPSTLASLP
ncbi:hypothetical protein H4R33_007052, partial [Dimargaris cristalligena]